MNVPTTELPRTLSDAALERFVAREEKPTFVCEWRRVLFAHYEVEREVLQRQVPFELELLEGQAVVSLVAFTMHRFHPRWGGRPMEWLARPVSTNRFFNVRTYVRHGGEPGVFFMHHTGKWFNHPRFLGANYSVGCRKVWMGRVRKLEHESVCLK